MANFVVFLLGLVSSYQNPKQDINFVVIGDTQWGYRILRESIKKINSQKQTEFLVHVGDQETCGGAKMLKRFKKRMSGLRVPYWLTIGNHELVMCGRKYGLYRSNWYKWRNFWGYRLSPRSNSKLSTYYYIDLWRHHHTFRLIFLDTSFVYISRKQALWFKSIMESTPPNTSVFIFSHKPLPAPYKVQKKKIYFNNGKQWTTYGRLVPPKYDRDAKIVWMSALRNKSKIRAVFHGHFHAFRSYYIEGIKGYCTGGGGGYLYRRKGRRTSEFHHYLNVHATPKSLNVSVVRVK